MIVRFFDWDQPKNVSSSLKNVAAKDSVVVEHEWGSFIAEVLLPDKSIEGETIMGKAVRKAEEDDFSLAQSQVEKGGKILEEAKKQAREIELAMKFVDVRISLDGSCAVVAFVADGRVDFRKLVKNLSALFGKSIRLQQIGSRDEARRCGGFGICGRELCCKKFPGSLKSISTDMARCQLISHRGAERISGLCGRLMCCLAFEAKQYQEMLEEMPKRGDKIKVDGKAGTVVDVVVMSGKVKVELDDGTTVFKSIK